jgi:mannose-6-phosphate isomerase
MYPLLLKAPIKDYLWGGTKLKTDFGFETEKEIAAEAWMLSCHKDGMNIVLNGEHKGKTLNEVLEIWGESALGNNAEKFSYFPILIKLIDAKQKLSVQVHPDDEYALANEGEFGKTEMWYIVDCEPDAKLAYGFKKNINKAQFEKRIKDNTLDEVINYVPVKKGDVFFIEAGTLHAIGEGILIAEVQQNSNTTCRVSDYGRVGADGKPRELHIDKALEVTNLKTPNIPYGDIGRVIVNNKNTIKELAVCDKFFANLLELNTQIELYSPESFVSLIVLDGNVSIKWSDSEIIAKKGDSVFVPACLKAVLSGQAEILYSCV